MLTKATNLCRGPRTSDEVWPGERKEEEPEKLQFDEGKEFYNRFLKHSLEVRGIKWFSTHSDKRAAIVEKLNRTLKTRIWKYFTEKQTMVWIDSLPLFIHGYNNTFHSTVGMLPSEARDEENSGIVWYNLYGLHLEKMFGKQKFAVGQSVRIQKFESTFKKGYLANYSEEVFKIKDINFTLPIVYKLADYLGEEIDGYFYEQELSFVPNPDKIEYKIEKIIRYGMKDGEKYALVKWKSYSDKFKSWEPVSQINKISAN